MFRTPIEISARHVHLSPADWKKLFGSAIIKPHRQISQPPQFVAKQRIAISGPSGRMDAVGIVGPLRDYTQVELSGTDARRLGVDAPSTSSGRLEQAGWIRLHGPKGSIRRRAAIIQQRHLHISMKDARTLGIKNGQELVAHIPGSRGGVLNRVLVRTNETYVRRLHLDTDEGNAFGIGPKMIAIMKHA